MADSAESQSDKPTPAPTQSKGDKRSLGFGKGGKNRGPVELSVPPRLFDLQAHWEWHITETFKGLTSLSIETIKALLLINGGAAIAILAYLGSPASRTSSTHVPHMKGALTCFALGVLIAATTFLVAYLTQLRLYEEERAWHQGEKLQRLHSIGIFIGTILILSSAVLFGVGCLIAASSF